MSAKLTADYVGDKYAEAFAQDKRSYGKNATAFASSMDSASATSFLTYAPINQDADGNDMIFGYVYNILLPFSTTQNVAYTEAKNMGMTESMLFNARRNIGKQIQGEDLRSSWISKHDHANYSYTKDGNYYFFEDNNGSKHEELKQYAGNYAFNGSVTEKEGEEEFEIKADKVSIDDFIKNEFEGYINETLAGTGAQASKLADSEWTSNYNTNDFYKTDDKGDEVVDYDNFTYYKGKVNFTETQTAAGFFDETTQQYKALSAVNELMFAYSTDTGCLNTYMGYSVSPYGTNFVKEFEAAAQAVVADGVGSYAVCLTDFGWHIVYCSFSFNAEYMGADNQVYGAYNHAEAVGDAKVEGSFSNLYYEYVKESAYTNYTSEVQNKALKKYDNETCVTRYEKRYKDLYNFNK